MRYLFLIFIIFLGVNRMPAQEISIKSLIYENQDLSAIKRCKLDNNNDTCALLKVFTTIPDVTFDGGIVEIHKTSTCYWVYLLDGTKSVTMLHRFLMPMDVQLKQFGLSRLEGGKTYYLTLNINKDLEALLKGQSGNVKMTRKRNRMIKLDNDYHLADSLYRKSWRNGPISEKEERVEMLERASKLGWPLATIKILEMKGVSRWNAEKHPDVMAQYQTLDEYLDWLYYEIKPFDDMLNDRTGATYKFELSSPPTYEESVACLKESKIREYERILQQDYFNSRNLILQKHDSEYLKKYRWIQKDPEFEPTNREAYYIFFQMKRLWYDIIKLTIGFKNKEYQGIDISKLDRNAFKLDGNVSDTALPTQVNMYNRNN